MTEIKSSDFTRQPGLILDRASRGETFLVTRFGRPLAVIGPPPADTKTTQDAS